MTNSLLQWHLARDNQVKLARFCEKNRVKQEVTDRYEVGGKGYFALQFDFDNGSYIKAELRAGDTQSYTIADHFQVIDYGWAK
jgi:hypothetical protein